MEIQKENEHYKGLYEKSLETLKEKDEEIAHLQGQLKERREWIRSLEAELVIYVEKKCSGKAV